MEVLDFALIMALQGFLCICSFIIGAKVGQKIVRGETIESPVKSPVEAYREAKNNFEYRREQDRLQTISDNIDNYDGTGIGQKDIPKI